MFSRFLISSCLRPRHEPRSFIGQVGRTVPRVRGFWVRSRSPSCTPARRPPPPNARLPAWRPDPDQRRCRRRTMQWGTVSGHSPRSGPRGCPRTRDRRQRLDSAGGQPRYDSRSSPRSHQTVHPGLAARDHCISRGGVATQRQLDRQIEEDLARITRRQPPAPRPSRRADASEPVFPAALVSNTPPAAPTAVTRPADAQSEQPIACAQPPPKYVTDEPKIIPGVILSRSATQTPCTQVHAATKNDLRRAASGSGRLLTTEQAVALKVHILGYAHHRST